MTKELVTYWRAGIADGSIKVPGHTFNRFLKWLESRRIEAEYLDREAYASWFADMALNGMGVREFGTTDIRIRGLYRSALRSGVISSVPMGDFPLAEMSEPHAASITEKELEAIMELAICGMQDPNALLRNRMISGRSGLVVALAYYSGLTSKQLVTLRVEQLTHVLEQEGLPDIFERVGEAYKQVRSELPGGPLDVLFPSSRLPPAAIKKYSHEIWDSAATCRPITAGNVFPEAVVSAAVQLDFHAPARFTLAEILRLRKAKLYSLRTVEWPSVNVPSALLTTTRTPQEWSEDDIIALAQMHPRFAEP